MSWKHHRKHASHPSNTSITLCGKLVAQCVMLPLPYTDRFETDCGNCQKMCESQEHSARYETPNIIAPPEG